GAGADRRACLRRSGSAPLFVSAMSEDGIRRLEASSGGRDPRSRGKYRIEMRREHCYDGLGAAESAVRSKLCPLLRKRSRNTPPIDLPARQGSGEMRLIMAAA